MEGEAPLLLSQQAVWAPCGGKKGVGGGDQQCQLYLICFCVVKGIAASAHSRLIGEEPRLVRGGQWRRLQGFHKDVHVSACWQRFTCRRPMEESFSCGENFRLNANWGGG